MTNHRFWVEQHVRSTTDNIDIIVQKYSTRSVQAQLDQKLTVFRIPAATTPHVSSRTCEPFFGGSMVVDNCAA